MRFFLSLSDFDETWWLWTTFGPEKSGGHFEVIGGQTARFFKVCRISTKLGGCGLHLVLRKVEVISKILEVKLPANLHNLRYFPKFVRFQPNLVGVEYSRSQQMWRSFRGHPRSNRPIFQGLSDSNKTWWMWTTFGPEKSRGYFEVI